MENNVEHDDTDAKRIQEVGPENGFESTYLFTQRDS